MDDLPPDLSRLGRELTAAIDRSLRWRRWRQRLVNRTAMVATSGALIFLAMTPAVLHPATARIDMWETLPQPDETQTLAWGCDSPPHNRAPLCDLARVADSSVPLAVDDRMPARRFAPVKGVAQRAPRP